MLDFKKLKKIINELEENNLFELFVKNLFNYDDLLNLIISYKFDNNFIIDIFDYTNSNKFVRYIFNFNNIDIINDMDNKDVIVKIININNYFGLKKDNYNLYLFSSLFDVKNKNDFLNILNELFENKISDIIIKYLQ